MRDPSDRAHGTGEVIASDLQNDKIWVIGVGSSAGGLEALVEFFSAIPDDLDACFIVAQHLAPHAKSMMVELLGRQSKLPVVAAEQGMALQARQVMIVPPNYDIDIHDNHVLLTQAGEETRPKPSVDRFFSSLASAFGNRAVGVILSGSGSDGADGMQAIKSAGGIALVQDDKTAKYASMPNASIQTGSVDYILPPKEMAERLPSILNAGETSHPILFDDSEPGFKEVLRLIRKDVGTDFSQYKITTIKRRLAKRMAEIQSPDIRSYYDLLKRDGEELRQLSQELLVSVTSFFRDAEAFSALEDHLKRIVSEKKDGEEIRVWSAGCATGEEAYSIAMLLADIIGDRPVLMKVFGTDLDHNAISHARVGIYGEQEVRALPPDVIERYFDRRGTGSFEVKKFIREGVVFARQDLIQNPPFVKLDVVSCRNVLIYFETELQNKVFEIFHYALRPGGLLFLGKSESLGTSSRLFEMEDKKNKLYIRTLAASKHVPSTSRPPQFVPAGDLQRRRAPMPPPIAQLAQAQMLQQLNLSGAVVDAEGVVHTILGNPSGIAKVSPGLTEFRLSAMLPRSAGVELQVLLRKAAKDKGHHKSRALPLEGEGSARQFYFIHVSLLSGKVEIPTPVHQLFVVTFEQFELDQDVVAMAANPSTENELALRVYELDQELAVTREHLQTTVEELGVSNEELQSVNEELSSTNEELQASNEELETTNEELQSTNEELTTLNEELNTKSLELRLTNTTLENVQSSIGSPMLVVDQELKVSRYNVSATELFDLGNSDIGRPIGRLSCRYEIPQFESMVRETVRSGRVHEVVVEAHRSVYQLRILPCRDDREGIVGAVIIFFNNTELIQAEDKWRRSEARVRSIINGTSSLISMKDTMGKYLSVNRAFLKFFDLKEADVIGRSDREIFSSDLANQFRNADLEALLRRTLIERQEELSGDNGQNPRSFLSSRFPIFDESGENAYAIGLVSIDITAQVRAQREMQQSETMYRNVVEDQSVFICRFEPNGRILFVNQAFCNYFGGRPVDFIGKPFSSFVDSNDRESVRRETARLSCENTTLQFEHRVSKFGASPRWVRWMTRGLCENETLTEIQAVGFDVTEYRVQTEQMIEKEVLFSNIFNHTADLVAIFKVSGASLVLESFNRSAEKGFGYSFAQYIGRPVEDFVAPGRRDEILQKYGDCVDQKTAQVFDEELNFQGSVRYLTTTLIPIPGANGKTEKVVALSRDITRFRLTELAMSEAKEAAEVASQSKSDFLASMSHELRTPLNVVIGMSQLLEMAELDADQKKQLESIQRSGKVLLSLIEDILDLSRIEAGKVTIDYAPFSITQLLRDVQETFGAQAARKGIELKVELQMDGLQNFIGDQNRIRQVLINLVGNALKFTDKGHVRVRLSEKSLTESRRTLVRFEVQDTGIGIPKEAHSRIFQKFSQVESNLNRRFGGTGLGLLISKRLITLMGGDIGFASDWGKGSTFWFEVPMSVSGVSDFFTEESKDNLKQIAPSVSSARILAVDDNADGLMVLTQFLGRLGHKVTPVDSGPSALEALKRERFDLVLMDVQMPEMDGYQATRQARKLAGLNEGIPIVALTANAMVGDSERCFEAGMNDYLTKPINVDALKSLIDRWARRPEYGGPGEEAHK